MLLASVIPLLFHINISEVRAGSVVSEGREEEQAGAEGKSATS